MSDARDAARWRFVRDVLWKHAKRSELPEDLYAWLADADTKYPNAAQLDEAVDALILGHITND